MTSDSTDAAAGPKRAPAITAEDYARIERICRAVAARRRHLFAQYPAISLDDLVQIALVGNTRHTLSGALSAHASFNSTSSYNTWVGNAAGAALIDAVRSMAAERRRVGNYTGVEHTPPECVFYQGTETEEQYRERVMVSFSQARRRMPTIRMADDSAPGEWGGVPEMLDKIPKKISPYYAGRIGHPAVAYATALAYRQEHGLGWRTFYAQLKVDVPLVRMLGFRSCPALSSFRDAVHRLRAWADHEAKAAQ